MILQSLTFKFYSKIFFDWRQETFQVLSAFISVLKKVTFYFLLFPLVQFISLLQRILSSANRTNFCRVKKKSWKTQQKWRVTLFCHHFVNLSIHRLLDGKKNFRARPVRQNKRAKLPKTRASNFPIFEVRGGDSAWG